MERPKKVVDATGSDVGVIKQIKSTSSSFEILSMGASDTIYSAGTRLHFEVFLSLSFSSAVFLVVPSYIYAPS